jgi:hypothetical protein
MDIDSTADASSLSTSSSVVHVKTNESQEAG